MNIVNHSERKIFMQNKKNLKPIPTFKNEKEESLFWDSHDTTEYFDTKSPMSMSFPKLKPTTKTITLRLSVDLLQRIRTIANKKDVPYQSLMKVFLDEKAREEALKL